jgi:hypothetical protein
MHLSSKVKSKLFKNAARARTVDTPRRFKAFPARLTQEALMTIASDPGVLGDARMA